MKFPGMIIGCGVLSANIMYYRKQLFDLDRHVEEYQLKQENTPVKVPQSVQNLVTTVMKDMKLNEKVQSLVKPFAMNNLTTGFLGYLGNASGIYFGIPTNYLYEFDKINFEKLIQKVDLKKLEAADLSKLKSSLSLSEKAKKFAIAQEMYESAHLSFYGRGFLSFVCFFAFFASILYAEKRKFQRIEKMKPVFFGHMAITFIFIYGSGYNIMNEHQSCYGDISAAKLGKEYVEGGLEYLDKLLTLSEIWDKTESSTERARREIHDCSLSSFSLGRRIAFMKKIQEEGPENLAVWQYLFYLREFAPVKREETASA